MLPRQKELSNCLLQKIPCPIASNVASIYLTTLEHRIVGVVVVIEGRGGKFLKSLKGGSEYKGVWPNGWDGK